MCSLELDLAFLCTVHTQDLSCNHVACQCTAKQIHSQVFHGCFEAVSPGCLNLDPNAFGGSRNGGSRFPAQVQVVQSERYPPTHWWLFENVPGLFYAGTNKVDQLLNDEQVWPLGFCFLDILKIPLSLGSPSN